MVVLISMVVVALFGVSCAAFFVVYDEGQRDGRWSHRGYNNTRGGMLSWVYDYGFNSVAAGEKRKQKNLERNRARQERLGE